VTDLWNAPVAPGPIRGTVQIPGSKSIANRALILASLATGPATIDNVPQRGRDIQLMIAGLRSLGTELVITGNRVAVTPRPFQGPAAIDCGLAGTVMRFLPPAAGLARGAIRFDGDEQARARPMDTLLNALHDIGLQVATEGSPSLPFTVDATGVIPGGAVTLDASRSSQFVSALLLSGARFEQGLHLIHRGSALPSVPHIEMTCALLAEHGVHVAANAIDRSHASWQIAAGELQPVNRTIEPDLSNATPFMAAAMLTGGEVLIADWPSHSVQPAAQLLAVLHQMGATTTATSAGMLVSGTGSINGITADLGDIGELVPTLTAICALADTPSTLTGIGHIAGHETNRLVALATEVNRLGGHVRADEDGLTITPRPLHSGIWETYADHRMATAGAIIGLMVPGVQVRDIATTAKTFQEFPRVWQSLISDGAR